MSVLVKPDGSGVVRVVRIGLDRWVVALCWAAVVSWSLPCGQYRLTDNTGAPTDPDPDPDPSKLGGAIRTRVVGFRNFPCLCMNPAPSKSEGTCGSCSPCHRTRTKVLELRLDLNERHSYLGRACGTALQNAKLSNIPAHGVGATHHRIGESGPTSVDAFVWGPFSQRLASTTFRHVQDAFPGCFRVCGWHEEHGLACRQGGHMPLPGPGSGAPMLLPVQSSGSNEHPGYAGDRAVGERLERRFPGKPVTKPAPMRDGRLEVRLSHARPPLPSSPAVTEVG